MIKEPLHHSRKLLFLMTALALTREPCSTWYLCIVCHVLCAAAGGAAYTVHLDISIKTTKMTYCHEAAKYCVLHFHLDMIQERQLRDKADDENQTMLMIK